NLSDSSSNTSSPVFSNLFGISLGSGLFFLNSGSIGLLSIIYQFNNNLILNWIYYVNIVTIISKIWANKTIVFFIIWLYIILGELLNFSQGFRIVFIEVFFKF